MRPTSAVVQPPVVQPTAIDFQLVNLSTVPTFQPSQINAIASAIAIQLGRDFAQRWNARASAVVVGNGRGYQWPVVFLDDADQADALGYHDVDPNGKPYSRVFVKTTLDAGGSFLNGPLSVSAVTSHEILETLGDPFARFWSDQPDGSEVALELCDPVEDQGYIIGGVTVSNFITPAWFDAADTKGPYDFMGTLTAPFSQTPGGYLITRGGAGTDGRRIVAGTFGKGMKPERAATKTAAGSRTLRRMGSAYVGDRGRSQRAT